MSNDIRLSALDHRRSTEFADAEQVEGGLRQGIQAGAVFLSAL